MGNDRRHCENRRSKEEESSEIGTLQIMSDQETRNLINGKGALVRCQVLPGLKNPILE